MRCNADSRESIACPILSLLIFGRDCALLLLKVGTEEDTSLSKANEGGSDDIAARLLQDSGLLTSFVLVELRVKLLLASFLTVFNFMLPVSLDEVFICLLLVLFFV
mmetsp:Transcript_17197/g.25606  ORF Transcript_17197/g.25606 Transcript_17197/m.25606 type:complete len:106 (-) Transcript_17197:39-356(-)